MRLCSKNLPLLPHCTPETTHRHPGVSEQGYSLLSQPLPMQPQASWDMAGSGVYPDQPCSIAEALAFNRDLQSLAPWCQSELSLASLACPIAPSSGPPFAAADDQTGEEESRGVPILEHKISEDYRAPCSALYWRVRKTKAVIFPRFRSLWGRVHWRE